MRLFLGFIALLLAVSSSEAADDRCRDILANGVWEYHDSIDDAHNVSSFLNWYGSTQSQSSNSTKKQSLTGSAIYDGAPLSLGLTNDSSKNDSFFSKIDSLHAGYQQYDSTVVNFVKTASKVIVKAWQDCMSASGGGLRASLQFTDDPKDIFIDIRYQPINSNSADLVAKVRIDRPDFVSCKNASGDIAVSLSGFTVRCSRSKGTPGAIILNSATVISSDKTMTFPAVLIQQDLTGKPYGKCDVVKDIPNGHDRLGASEPIEVHDDMGGGGTQSKRLQLDVGSGFKLSNVKASCIRVSGNNPCAFVHDLGAVVWDVPDRRAHIDLTTDSDRVTIELSGVKQQVFPGTDDVKGPAPLVLQYGKSFGVEFPTNALDVKLYCTADGSQRIYSLSDLQDKGDQIYLQDVRNTATGKIFDLAVAPFELRQ